MKFPRHFNSVGLISQNTKRAPRLLWLLLFILLPSGSGCSGSDPVAPLDIGGHQPVDQQAADSVQAADSAQNKDNGDLTAGDLGTPFKDLLTPGYYTSGAGSSLRKAVDAFLSAARATPLHHPLEDKAGKIPSFMVLPMGTFCSIKGPAGAATYHPAVDLRVGNKETAVTLFAAHDGVVSTVRNADKYRQYVAITRTVVDSGGKALGKQVTLYAHVDLDKDEAAGLKMNGKQVNAGDAVSQNLYAGTVGGPHLHLELRFYRPADAGTETFYGLKAVNPTFTQASAGGWTLGYWDPSVGYGFGHPGNHGLNLP
jgi:murein DD-endopeptidase MepM/ murein hydrolase activator NlpD